MHEILSSNQLRRQQHFNLICSSKYFVKVKNDIFLNIIIFMNVWQHISIYFTTIAALTQ